MTPESLSSLASDPARVLIGCLRVGATGETPIPRGFELADCSGCGHAVWVCSDSVPLAVAHGLVPVVVCRECVAGGGL